MGAWLDFVMVALALGLGWLGWILYSLARLTSPHAPRRLAQAKAYTLPKNQVFRFK